MGFPQLETARLRTRPWEQSDATWHDAALDEDIRRFTLERAWLSTEPGPDATIEAAPDASVSAVVVDESGPVGSLGVHRRDDAVELSYWVAAPARGKGYATELLDAASAWAMVEFGADSTIELRIHPDNQASMRVAERAGYRFTGRRATCDGCAGDDGTVVIYTLGA